MKVILLTFFYLLIAKQKAKVYDVCDLYYMLKFFRMDPFKGIYSEQYVCAADYSSRLDTLYYENIRGLPRYGIFQLSGLEWCDNGRHPTQNKCNTSCDLFLDDDIQDDILCIKKVVQSTMDMRAWPLYLKYCNRHVVNHYYIKCLFGRAYSAPQKIIQQKTRTSGLVEFQSLRVRHSSSSGWPRAKQADPKAVEQLQSFRRSS